MPPGLRSLFCSAVFLCLVPANSGAWFEEPGYRWKPLNPPGNRPPGFDRRWPKDTGLDFENRLDGEAFYRSFDYHNGSGVAAGDVNGDGTCDLFFCALQGPNRLYLNQGKWRFTEVPAGPAALPEWYCTGAAFADVDGDADIDLLVNAFDHGTSLFLNDGNGGLARARNAGLHTTGSPTSLALGDTDRDGDLDLYVAYYRSVALRDHPDVRLTVGPGESGFMEVIRVDGVPADDPKWAGRFNVTPEGRIIELGEPDRFYENLGDGRFRWVPFDQGKFSEADGSLAPTPRDYGLAVMIRDLNGDRAPDIYVCNDNDSPDRFWLNRGDGTFQEAGPEILRHTSRSSMGIAAADLNRDGHDDFLVVDMLASSRERRLVQLHRDLPSMESLLDPLAVPRLPRNTLQLNRGDGTFAEIAWQAGVAATDWSWCPAFMDVDLDGFQDLLVTTGFALDLLDSDAQDRIEQYQRRRRSTPLTAAQRRRLLPPFHTIQRAYRNQGDLTFEDRSTAWGFTESDIAHGMALADLDADGDQDLVLNRLNAPAAVYENRVSNLRLAIRLRGRAPNSFAVGARLQFTSWFGIQSKTLQAGGPYLSCDDTVVPFAVPMEPSASSIQIRWPDGSETRIDDLQAGRLYEVSESAVKPRLAFPSDQQSDLAEANPWFLETRLPPAPPATSRSPAIVDLQAGLPYRVDLEGDYEIWWAKGPNTKSPTTILQRTETATQQWVFQPESGWSAQLRSSPSRQSSPTSSDSEIDRRDNGVLAMADIDRDGNLDAFVGGRILPGRYPESSPSRMFLRRVHGFEPHPQNRDLFSDVSLVRGALFTDLDVDGDADLVLACAWGPIRVWINEGGKLDEQTSPWQLQGLRGWWQGVASGDFDEDGLPDLIATNVGRNTAYEPYIAHGIRLYHRPPDPTGKSGPVRLMEAHWDSATSRWVPFRDRLGLAAAFPGLVAAFRSHATFAQADVDAIATNIGETFAYEEARWADSVVLLNRGRRFEVQPLPREAQWAPAFGVAVTDADGDGHQDVFLGQNLFGLPPLLGRYDAGQGLLLRGRGDGTFEPMAARQSGIRLMKEQRGVAWGDFNHDRRPDLAISLVGQAPVVFENQRASPTLAATLIGPPGNPSAVGAKLRLVYPDRKGPTIEVRSNGAADPSRAPPTWIGGWTTARALEVTWPDGETTEVPIADAKEGRLVLSQEFSGRTNSDPIVID